MKMISEIGLMRKALKFLGGPLIGINSNVKSVPGYETMNVSEWRRQVNSMRVMELRMHFKRILPYVNLRSLMHAFKRWFHTCNDFVLLAGEFLEKIPAGRRPFVGPLIAQFRRLTSKKPVIETIEKITDPTISKFLQRIQCEQGKYSFFFFLSATVFG